MDCIRPDTAFGRAGRATKGGGGRATAGGGQRAAAALIVLSDVGPVAPGEILAAAATPAMSAVDTDVMKWPYIVGFRARTGADKMHGADASSLLMEAPGYKRLEGKSTIGRPYGQCVSLIVHCA